MALFKRQKRPCQIHSWRCNRTKMHRPGGGLSWSRRHLVPQSRNGPGVSHRRWSSTPLGKPVASNQRFSAQGLSAGLFEQTFCAQIPAPGPPVPPPAGPGQSARARCRWLGCPWPNTLVRLGLPACVARGTTPKPARAVSWTSLGLNAFSWRSTPPRPVRWLVRSQHPAPRRLRNRSHAERLTAAEQLAQYAPPILCHVGCAARALYQLHRCMVSTTRWPPEANRRPRAGRRLSCTSRKRCRPRAGFSNHGAVRLADLTAVRPSRLQRNMPSWVGKLAPLDSPLWNTNHRNDRANPRAQ
jgi:hypothetical protein